MLIDRRHLSIWIPIAVKMLNVGYSGVGRSKGEWLTESKRLVLNLICVRLKRFLYIVVGLMSRGLKSDKHTGDHLFNIL